MNTQTKAKTNMRPLSPILNTVSLFAVGMALVATGGLAQKATAPAGELKAVQAVTVQANGPRTGDTGDRFFNVEGKQTGKYASYGLIRFDGAEWKKEATAHANGKAVHVTDVILQLSQSNASFTKNGPMQLYFRADDKLTTDNQALKYPYLPTDKTLGGEKLPLGTATKRTDTLDGEAVVLESYDLTAADSGKALKTALEAGKAITLILDAGDTPVANTYAGLKGVKHRKPPTLVIKTN